MNPLLDRPTPPLAASVALQLGLLLLVALQRLLELRVSARHVAALRARGAVEHGRGHYPAMVAAHVFFLAAWTVETAARRPPVDAWCAGWLLVFAAAQAARAWTLRTLGDRWTTRVLVLPGAPPVRRGPYRWLRHPNYVVVVTEIAALALAFRATATLLVSLALQAAVLGVRIRVESRALREQAGDAPR